MISVNCNRGYHSLSMFQQRPMTRCWGWTREQVKSGHYVLCQCECHIVERVPGD